MTDKPIIRIGPAGWSYKDWEGVVYPQTPGAKFDPLEYLTRFFNTIEINSSFYRPFTASTANSWARRVAGAADFMFTAKLHRVFTHERGKATAEDEGAVREGMDALLNAGKLGAVLHKAGRPVDFSSWLCAPSWPELSGLVSGKGATR